MTCNGIWNQYTRHLECTTHTLVDDCVVVLDTDVTDVAVVNVVVIDVEVSDVRVELVVIDVIDVTVDVVLGTTEMSLSELS
eukprot:m.947302 g.947302  ORF g.947302 m.947302 type:complete len:81 (+) comp23848_c0_seq38:2227-2469(+)